MKKLFLCAVIAVFGLSNVSAQGVTKASANVGFITGDFSDGFSFSLAVDVSQLWEVSDDIDAGATVGFQHAFGKDVNGFTPDDVSFIPIAAAGRFHASEEFTIGVDLGYAIGVNDGNDGGFYYAPKVQYSVSESLDVVAAYRGVSIDAGPVTVGFNTVTLGVEFAL